jgi:hypothetical protein
MHSLNSSKVVHVFCFGDVWLIFAYLHGKAASLNSWYGFRSLITDYTP